MMGQILLMLGLPVALGLAVRSHREAFAVSFEPKATRVATVLFVLIVLAAVLKNWALLRDNYTALAPLAILLNVAMLLCGFTAAALVRLSRRQSVTLGIETAMQNATLALVIASSVLGQGAMAIPGAIYGVLMYAGGLAFAFTMRRYTTAEPAAATAAA